GEQLATLLDISASLNRALELEAVLPRIADDLFKLFREAERCFVILWDEPTGRLVPKLVKARLDPANGVARFSRTIVKHCLRSRKGLLSLDVSQDNRFSRTASIHEFCLCPARSVICAPMYYGDGRWIGVIQLDTEDRSAGDESGRDR